MQEKRYDRIIQTPVVSKPAIVIVEEKGHPYYINE